jgi:hypothetical protein
MQREYESAYAQGELNRIQYEERWLDDISNPETIPSLFLDGHKPYQRAYKTIQDFVETITPKLDSRDTDAVAWATYLATFCNDMCAMLQSYGAPGRTYPQRIKDQLQSYSPKRHVAPKVGLVRGVEDPPMKAEMVAPRQTTRVLETTADYDVIKRWEGPNDYNAIIKKWVCNKYEVRKYPAGTPGGEYQKWIHVKGLMYEYVCECRTDGRDLKNFTYAEKREVQTATVTFEDVFDDIRLLADMLRHTTQKEAIHREINEEKERFLSVYSEEHGLEALSGLVALVVRMQQLIPGADKEPSKLAAFLVSFCKQMKEVFETVKPYGSRYTLQIQRLLEQYYSSPPLPLALLLAKLKRLGQW